MRKFVDEKGLVLTAYALEAHGHRWRQIIDVDQKSEVASRVHLRDLHMHHIELTNPFAEAVRVDLRKVGGNASFGLRSRAEVVERH